MSEPKQGTDVARLTKAESGALRDVDFGFGYQARVDSVVEQIVAERTADLSARLAAVEALADENAEWKWQAPVGPGNASYANGYENGRRAAAADLRGLLAANNMPAVPDHERGEACYPRIDICPAHGGRDE